MIYGYARVSTSGQDLKTQIDELMKKGVSKENIYQEKITGTNKQRPEFQRLLKTMKQNDTLVVTKMDRFARSTKDALEIIEDLFTRDITVNILNLGIIEDTPTGRLIFTVFSAFADFERDLILERMQEGKEFAKKNNPDYKEGRPNRVLNKRYMHALKILESHTYKETAEITGISTATLSRIRRQYLDEQSIKTHENTN